MAKVHAEHQRDPLQGRQRRVHLADLDLRDQRRFETDDKDLYKCESLGDALERALKALIVASGHRVAHRHGLRALRTQAEAMGGPLPGDMADADLDHLTKYTGEFLYPAQGARELDPRAVWERLETPIREVVAYAERRVPELVKATWKRIKKEQRHMMHRVADKRGGDSPEP